MYKRPATITPLGCFTLGLILAGLMFALATFDLLLPRFDYPAPGQRTEVSYRIPSVGVLLELDERSLYSQGRVEVPVGSKVVEWPSGGGEQRLARFELPAGSPLRHRDLSFLRALEEHRRPPGLAFSMGLGVLLLGLFTFGTHAARLFVRQGHQLRVQLVMFLSLLAWLALCKALLLFTPLSVFWIPLAALSMIWALLHSRLAGVLVGAVGALAGGALFPMDWALAVTLAAQAVVPPLLMATLLKRRTPGLVWMGGAVAALLAYGGYHFLTQGMLPAADLADWQRSGLIATVGAAAVSPFFAYGLRPLFAWMLGIVSRGRLMALADLDHPLLREVTEEAPGTWQHTLAMANMAEVVCNAVGANGNLVRVGAYFHDVGKLETPKYFAENLETEEPSPHDELPPEQSAAIIFDHVRDGVELAREHQLPKAIQAFIYTHHGDGVLEFFWHRCQQQGNPQGLSEQVFHYPGLPPQTREEAILAIVDSVEAASRSLQSPDADQIDDLVRRIVFGKLGAGLLDEAGLTATDLSAVVRSLRDMLRSQFHLRPEYPWQKKARLTAEAAAPAAHDATEDAEDEGGVKDREAGSRADAVEDGDRGEEAGAGPREDDGMAEPGAELEAKLERALETRGAPVIPPSPTRAPPAMATDAPVEPRDDELPTDTIREPVPSAKQGASRENEDAGPGENTQPDVSRGEGVGRDEPVDRTADRGRVENRES